MPSPPQHGRVDCDGSSRSGRTERGRGRLTCDSIRRARVSSCRRRSAAPSDRHFCSVLLVAFALLLAPTPPTWVLANDDYNGYGGGAAANNDDYSNYGGGGGGGGDDQGQQQQQQYYDDVANNNYYNGGQYGGGGGGDDAYSSSSSSSSSSYQKEQQQYQNKDDDVFHWDANAGFDGVSVMPLSCINYNSGHMIKFQLFDSAASRQCHFNEISTFVVSISHYMRAYFNYQALRQGDSFKLPQDAALLNCMQIENVQLYAKIGCMERETFTSTKLQLRVYMDSQCSQPYDDGQTARQHATRGYKIGDGYLETKVSFRPPFYSCLSCTPEISGTFNKKSGYWYDDDYISKSFNGNNNKNNQNNNANNNNNADDGANKAYDDKYMAANDDVKYDDAARYRRRGRQLSSPFSQDDMQAYEQEFRDEVQRQKQLILQQAADSDAGGRERGLYDNYYDVGNWNMCQRIYKYGMWCDQECRALDFFRADQWSTSDIFLLVIMCVFITAMMLLIVAKRLKAQQKSRMYGVGTGSDDLLGNKHRMPGLPPAAMAVIYLVILATVITLAKIRFINETLLFAVAACLLLFIYMLKLTLFESRQPILLAAPRHDIFVENPLSDHLFD